MANDNVGKKKFSMTSITKKYGIVILFLLAVILCSILSDTFFTKANIFNVLKQVSIIIILAYGEFMLIVSGGIDLSAGAVVAASGTVSALMYNSTNNIIVAILVSLAIGFLAGCINGFLVTQFSLPPFMVTLGMQIFMRGGALWACNSTPVPIEGELFKILGQGETFGIPNLLYLIFFLLIVFIFVMNRTAYGRYLYAIGGNREAAKASGVKVNKVIFLAYAFAGILSGLGGFGIMSRLNSGTPTVSSTGVAYEFDAIIGIILGGASMSGGTGSVFYAVLGCIFIGILNNTLNLLNVQTYYQQIVKGLLILVAITFDAISKGNVLKIKARKKA
jgi:inositol transport system permease protein